MDNSNVSSYRPVSNLPHLSKILERIVHRQLIGHIEEFKLLPDVQSACHRGHFTETAVLKVYSDFIDAISNGKLALLSLMDLKAAFDMVDHAILLRRLETTFGFRGTTLKWLSSYLEGHTQSVNLNGQSTDARGWFSALLRVLCWDLCCSYSTQQISAKLSDSMVSVIIFMWMTINCMGAAFHTILQLLER